MSIYADNRGGKRSGRFVVEVERKGKRLKARCDNESEAKLKEAEFRYQLETGRVPANAQHKRLDRVAVGGPATLSMLRKAVDGRVWRGMAIETANLANLRIMEEVMGDVALDRINGRWVEDLKAALVKQRAVSPATVNRYLACLSKALKWAIKMEMRTVQEMPEMAFATEDSGRIRWFSADEEAKAYTLVTDRIAKVIRLAIRTGMRRGELLGVEPKQVTKGWVHLWDTKSGSPRSIPLTPEDEADLNWLADGRMPTVQQLRVAWEKLRKDMGLQNDTDFVFHCTRHTFGTRAAEKGVHPRVIQQLMGHKSFSMTERYTHMSDQLLRGALGQMFG